MKPWERKLYDWGLLGYLVRDVIGAEQEESFGIRQNHNMYLTDWTGWSEKHFAAVRVRALRPGARLGRALGEAVGDPAGSAPFAVARRALARRHAGGSVPEGGRRRHADSAGALRGGAGMSGLRRRVAAGRPGYATLPLALIRPRTMAAFTTSCGRPNARNSTRGTGRTMSIFATRSTKHGC